MGNKRGLIIAFLGVLIASGCGIFIYSNSVRNTPNTSACLIYGVFEKKITGAAREANSGFFSFDPKTNSIQQIGSLQMGQEYQGIERDLVSGDIVTNTSNDGLLQVLSIPKGTLKKRGSIPFIKISSFAYHRTEQSLWGWAEEQGIVRIDPQSADAVLYMPSGLEVGAIAWDDTGTKLYAAHEESRELSAYDPKQKKLEMIAGNIPENTSGMATVENGLLLGAAFDEDEKHMTIYLYDPAKKETLRSIEVDTEFDDISGITWPIECGIPF